MGLIKAAIGAAGGALADTWKDFFVCDSMDKTVLAVKGEHMIGKRSSNKKGNDNIISSGSGIVVADGQCMIIVDQGKVVEFCAEPGEFTYDASSEPSLFTGDLGTAISDTFNTIGKRIGYGGDTGKDQRVYYFNTKELMDNKFGTPNPIPFRIVDKNIGLDLDSSVRCSGSYSYKIADPLLFYVNVCGNISDVFVRAQIESQMKMEFISALQPAFAKLSELEIRPNQIPAHTKELEDAMNEQLSSEWSEKRGLKVISIAIGTMTIPDADLQAIQNIQKAGALKDPTLAAATLAGAQADAMRAAASNTSGAMNGFIGMGMAQNAGGASIQNLYQMGAGQGVQAQNAQAQGTVLPPSATVSQAQAAQAAAQTTAQAQGAGTAAAGARPKFCPNCGEKTPDAGNFCPNCGTKIG